MELKKIPRKPLGEILIEEGLLNPESLEKALKIQKEQGGLVGEILIRIGACSEEELVLGLSKQLSIPFIQLARYRVNRNSLRWVPREVAERYLCFPFEEEAEEVSLAMMNPADPEMVEEIKQRLPNSVYVFLARASEIKEAIGTYYQGKGHSAGGG